MQVLTDFWPSLLFIGTLLLLPFVAQWTKKKGWYRRTQTGQSIKILDTVRLTHQQQVTVVEWIVGADRKQLLLGITPQSITLLGSVDLPTESTTSERPHHAN